MAIEIVDLSSYKMVDLSIAMLVITRGYSNPCVWCHSWRVGTPPDSSSFWWTDLAARKENTYGEGSGSRGTAEEADPQAERNHLEWFFSDFWIFLV